MFTEFFLLNLIRILQNILLKISSHISFVFFLCLVYLVYSSHSASISTLNNLSSISSSNQEQFISNNTYRNFILRQYFIDLLNISHRSIVRSMIYNHHLTSRSIQSKQKSILFSLWNFISVKNRRRKRSYNDDSPIYTLQSSNCLIINNKQVQSTFLWSQIIESLSSIEIIYHIDSLIERKQFTIPIYLKFKHSQTLEEFFQINTYLEFDTNRDFYFINIYQYTRDIYNQTFIIETILQNETCQTSHTYIIISTKNFYLKPNQTLKLNPILSYDLRQLKQQTINSTVSICKLKTIQIQFEDLGLAYLIIRPKQYTFTYCDGTCSYSTLQQQKQSSMHALFQSIVNEKNPNIPQPTCVPTQFADDNFLLRQTDGSIEIYPIKDVIVKQCACLWLVCSFCFSVYHVDYLRIMLNDYVFFLFYVCVCVGLSLVFFATY